MVIDGLYLASTFCSPLSRLGQFPVLQPCTAECVWLRLASRLHAVSCQDVKVMRYLWKHWSTAETMLASMRRLRKVTSSMALWWGPGKSHYFSRLGCFWVWCRISTNLGHIVTIWEAVRTSNFCYPNVVLRTLTAWCCCSYFCFTLKSMVSFVFNTFVFWDI